MEDIQGQALVTYLLMPDQEVELTLHTNYGKPESMPAEVFFREFEDFSDLEKKALASCEGKVLDVGAGAGAFTLELLERGHAVSALEISELSCQIMRERGIKDVLCEDLWTFARTEYDTVLLMMNGLGLAGTLERLPDLLQQLAKNLKPGGKIITDTSDIRYLYEGKKLPKDRYFGEVEFRYEFNGLHGDWFPWVYPDPAAVQQVTDALGWQLEILYEEDEQYLLRITPL